MDKKTRCEWANPSNPNYINYHDNEWGRAVHDDRHLFEMLILEGAQAGLSWETVLNRREGYRKVFHDFDVVKVASMSDDDLEVCRADERIIRNKLKIKATRQNAQVFIEIQHQFGSFDQYLWSYVNHQPVINHWTTLKDIPVTTKISDEISKDLKQRGMSFVGPTIIYAYMQATGMVNDHTMDCFCYGE